MTDKEAMAMALDALETEVSIDWTNNDEFNASAEKMHEAITALKERLAQPAQRTEQEPVAWLVEFENGEQELHFDKQSVGETQTPLYTHPPQRTWIGLKGAEFGWFCHTDFLNARKYTKEQRKKICCQLLSEAQSWDIGEYQLMMHDSTKIKEKNQ